MLTSDQVLLLLHNKSNKLCTEWQGPCEVISKVSDVDYKIDVKRLPKVIHVNILANFHKPEQSVSDVTKNIVTAHYQTETA